MKLPLIGGALCLAALSACAGITNNTGVTTDQQICIVNAINAMRSDAAARDLRITQKAALVSSSCQVSLDAALAKLAE